MAPDEGLLWHHEAEGLKFFFPLLSNLPVRFMQKGNKRDTPSFPDREGMMRVSSIDHRDLVPEVSRSTPFDFQLSAEMIT